LLSPQTKSGAAKKNRYLMLSSRRFFLKQVGLGSAGLACIAMAPAYYNSAGNRTLPRSTPEEQGVSASGLNSFWMKWPKAK
jgi:hypothetical protein